MSNPLQPYGLQHARLSSFTISQSLLKFMSVELVILSNHLIFCHLLLFFFAFNLSQHQGLFQWVSSLHPIKWCNFPHSSVNKESACNAGDLGSIPGLGRSPGEGNGNPLQCSCLENPMDRGACRATVHGVARVRCDWATTPPPASNVDEVLSTMPGS